MTAGALAAIIIAPLAAGGLLIAVWFVHKKYKNGEIRYSKKKKTEKQRQIQRKKGHKEIKYKDYKKKQTIKNTKKGVKKEAKT